MDPIAVLKTFWHHKWFVLPIFLLTIGAAIYMFQYAPRSYQASASYAIVNPSPPTEAQMEKNPELKKLNPNNPYLRSSDPTLIAQVIITRLNDTSTADVLESKGLSTDYTAARGQAANGFIVEISATADNPETVVATVKALGAQLESYLYSSQKINDADDVYLFTSLVVASPDKATEQFSSRLRSLIVVFLVGGVLLLGAVSAARAIEAARDRRPVSPAGSKKGRRGNAPAESPEPPLETAPSVANDEPRQPKRVIKSVPTPRELEQTNSRKSRVS